MRQQSESPTVFPKSVLTTIVLLVISGCGIPIADRSAEAQAPAATGPCDSSDANSVNILRIVLENDYENGFTRDEILRDVPAACEAGGLRTDETLGAYIVCVVSLVDEIWTQPIVRTARQTCLRAGFDELAVDSIFDLFELARDEGFSRADLLPAVTQCDEPENNSRCIEEGGRLDECIVACQSCMLAALSEVFP